MGAAHPLSASSGICLPSVPAIGGALCFVTPTGVVLSRQSIEVGSAIAIVASAHGSSCGCCGGRAPTTIVHYDWDLAGDGTVDRSGPDLIEVHLPPPAGGRVTIAVTVTDSAGVTASDAIAVEP